MKSIMIFYARLEAAEETRNALNDKVVSIVSGRADGLPPLSLLLRINRRSRSKSRSKTARLKRVVGEAGRLIPEKR